jgi:hypothetical protein
MRCLNLVQGWKVAYLLWPDTNVWTAETDFPEGNLNGVRGRLQLPLEQRYVARLVLVIIRLHHLAHNSWWSGRPTF